MKIANIEKMSTKQLEAMKQSHERQWAHAVESGVIAVANQQQEFISEIDAELLRREVAE